VNERYEMSNSATFFYVFQVLRNLGVSKIQTAGAAFNQQAAPGNI